MADPPRIPGGWLPPQPPQRSEPQRAPERQAPVFVRPAGEQGTNRLAIAALVCAVASLGLLVLSLGLSFIFSLPLGIAGWICAAKAPRDVQPGQRKVGLILAIAAVALSVAAAAVWIVLIAAGVSVQDLQQNLQDELDRQRRAGS
jgi:O-antigen ligase